MWQSRNRRNGRHLGLQLVETETQVRSLGRTLRKEKEEIPRFITTMSDQNAIYDFPNEIVDQLLCSHCNMYISCGPIKVRPDGGTVCGRCSPATEGYTRIILFETVMSKFMFPCRYKQQGCQRRLLFGAIEHEDVCPYRTFSCPSYGSCSENMSVFDVYKHFENNHDNLIVKNGKFELDLEQNSQSNFLMIENDVVVTVQYSFDSIKKVFYLDVRYFASNTLQGVCYKLQMISGLDAECIMNFKENACHRYEWHMLNKEDACKFDMNKYLPALDNPNFIYIKVTLANNSITSSNALSSNTEPVIEDRSLVNIEQKALDAWNSLESIRCGKCYCISLPPVWQMSVYGGLRNSTMYCSACQQQFQHSHITEKLVENLDFPCRWRGCTFIGNKSNIKKHVEECEFRTYICPVSCKTGFYTPSNIMDHILQHGTYCPDPNKVIVELFCTGSLSKEYFTLFKNKLLAFTCNITNDYCWNLKIGKNKFTFDLYFEHDHCLFKSKTYSNIKDDCVNTTYEPQFPECFKSCRRVSAILKITSV